MGGDGAQRWAWAVAAGSAVLTVVYALALLGPASDAVYVVLFVTVTAATVVGICVNRPKPALPWWLLVAGGQLAFISAVVRDSVGALGDMSAHRSLLPDAFSLPGYACFAATLLGLLRARRQGDRDRASVLDAAMLSLGMLVVGGALVLNPILQSHSAAPIAKLSILAYPPISLFLVVLAAQLAFGPGQRSTSHRLLLAGTTSLLLGDVTYLFVETHVLVLPANLCDLPYGMAYALIAAAALHPSMRGLSAGRAAGPARLSRARLALVASALLVPSYVLLVWTPTSMAERMGVFVAAVGLSVAAIVRVLGAMRQQSRSEAHLAYQAAHDDLTGLANRTLAAAWTDEQLEHGAVALLFIDLDRFKLVNDTLGHSGGDNLLVVAAQRLAHAVRPGDLVARISGDEFMVVAPGLDLHGARSLGERLRLVFDEPIDVGSEVVVTASIGVTMGDRRRDVTVNGAGLMRDADTAMYRAKASGRNGVVLFDAVMREEIARRVELEGRLRRALAVDELDVHYQPVIDLASGRVEGFEALCRWPAPDGMIAPDEFISVAEESGLILPLGTFVLEHACRELAAWRRRPGWAELTVAVNVSARQFHHDDIVETVADVLDATGLPGRALWLELTESAMLEHTVDTAAALVELRRLGVRLSLDDFGTGFSSLSYLKRFPIDRVKVDRTFVHDLTRDDADASLVGAIVAMAGALSLTTVAEGVETREQADRLVSLGCSHTQGFYYAKATPAAEIPTLVDRLNDDLAAVPTSVPRHRARPVGPGHRHPWPERHAG